MRRRSSNSINNSFLVQLVFFVAVNSGACLFAGQSCLIHESDVKQWDEFIDKLYQVDMVIDRVPKNRLSTYIDWSYEFRGKSLLANSNNSFRAAVPNWIRLLTDSPQNGAQFQALAETTSKFNILEMQVPPQKQLVLAKYPFDEFEKLVELLIVRSQSALSAQEYHKAVEAILVAWRVNDVCLQKAFGISRLGQAAAIQRRLTNYLLWMIPQLPKQSRIALNSLPVTLLPSGAEFIQRQLTSDVLTYEQYDSDRKNAKATLRVLDNVFSKKLANDDLDLIIDFRKYTEAIPQSDAPLLPDIVGTVYCRKQVNLDRFTLRAFQLRTDGKEMSNNEIQKSLLAKASSPMKIEFGEDFISIRLEHLQMEDEIPKWMGQRTMRINY